MTDVAATRKALADACGDVQDGGDLALEDLGFPEPAFVVAPPTTEAAAAALRLAVEDDLAVVIRGGGSRLAWGTPPTRCDLVIDTSRMSGVVEHAAGDLVARIRAGTPMGEVATVLARAGQEIALDVPTQATVGGMIASGLAGPRRLRYGTPRDLLIGITVVRPDGTIAKSGGKVVKNVAGYDLGKLFTGSAGTLGLITEATFRLHPLPAARAYVTAEYPSVHVAAEMVATAANSPLVASAVEISRHRYEGRVKVGVLLEGSADGVTSRAASMAGLLGPAQVSSSPPHWWPGAGLLATAGGSVAGGSVAGGSVAGGSVAGGSVAGGSVAGGSVAGGSVAGGSVAGGSVAGGSVAGGSVAGESAVAAVRPRADALRIQVSFWVSALGRVVDAIEAAASDTRLDAVISGSAGAGLLNVAVGHWVANDPPPAAARDASAVDFIRRLRTALAGQRGNVVVLAAPAGVREALAAHGGMNGDVPGLALMRAVKDQFDPGHRMAPGRFPDTP